ncbi:MAG: RidA family protein, partial [Actinomycetota bacterium]
MDHIRHLNPDDVAAPRATYSHVVRARGEVLWLAGQVSIDEQGRTVGGGDVAAQLEQVTRNIERILTAAGAGWTDVVRAIFYVVGAANIAAARAARAALWPRLFPDGSYPASTFLLVAGLASEEFLVEIEVTA